MGKAGIQQRALFDTHCWVSPGPCGSSLQRLQLLALAQASAPSPRHPGLSLRTPAHQEGTRTGQSGEGRGQRSLRTEACARTSGPRPAAAETLWTLLVGMEFGQGPSRLSLPSQNLTRAC